MVAYDRIEVYENPRYRAEKLDFKEAVVLRDRRRRLVAVLEAEPEEGGYSVFAYGFTPESTPFMVWGVMSPQTYEKLKRGEADVVYLLSRPLHLERNTLMVKIKRRYMAREGAVKRKLRGFEELVRSGQLLRLYARRRSS